MDEEVKPHLGVSDLVALGKPKPEGGWSINADAERIMGKRPYTGGLIIDQPCELGYVCPVCVYEPVIDGNFDERLEFSEYNSFLWCSVCNRDYPSALCLAGEIDYAIDVFLVTVADVAGKEPGDIYQRMNDHVRRLDKKRCEQSDQRNTP